jgi:hypothetical protein
MHEVEGKIVHGPGKKKEAGRVEETISDSWTRFKRLKGDLRV